MWRLILIAPLLTGCANSNNWGFNDRPERGLPFYTQAEVDAITTEQACKQLARTPVEVSRCMTRR